MALINLLRERVAAAAAGGGEYVYTKRVPTNEVWKVRAVCGAVTDDDQAIIELGVYDGVYHRRLVYLKQNITAAAVNFSGADWQGEIYLREGDKIYVYVYDATAAAVITLDVYGEILLEREG